MSQDQKKNEVGTRWVSKNKFNEDGNAIRNKERLVCKGHSQMKVIDFEETFSPLARSEVIKMFLAFSCLKNFKIYQKHVNQNSLLEI